METDTWEEDIQWFLMRCAEDKRPKPSEFARDAFADKVAMRLSSCVYPGSRYSMRVKKLTKTTKTKNCTAAGGDQMRLLLFILFFVLAFLHGWWVTYVL